MHAPLVTLHSILRWLVILFGLVATIRAVRGRRSIGWWKPVDSRAGLLFVGSLDLQVLIGLLNYFLFSPLTTGAVRNLDAAMADRVLRFWTLEHPGLMILALLVAHLGRVRTRRATEDRERYARAAFYYTVSWVLVLAGTPWPFQPYGRPLLPF